MKRKFILANKKCLAESMLLILLGTAALKAEISFTQHDLTANFTQACAVDVVDADNDGDKDIFGVAMDPGEVSWWENDGSQGFTTKHVLKTPFYSGRDVKAANLDNDNLVDVVATQYLDNKVTIFFNACTSEKTELVIDSALAGAHTVNLIDMDHDNDLDIAVSACNTTAAGNGGVVWYENTGNRNFIRHQVWDKYKRATFAFAADIDNDNDIDFLTCNEIPVSGRVSWLINSGDNLTFTEQVVDSAFSYAHTVIARDLDKDGDLDILGTSCMDSQIAWWENDGNRNFSKHSLNILIQPQPYYALWLDMADFDLDGDNDLILAMQGFSKPFWLKNNGNQNFTAISIGPLYAFRGGYQIIPADVDSDGDMDLVGAGHSVNFNVHKITWWENDAVTSIEEPVNAKDSGLLHNYPNPFNPQTTISIALQQETPVQLAVYDSNGAHIKELCNNRLSAGSHAFNFDGTNLESGIYFCKMTAGNSQYCKKIALIK